MKKPFIGIGVMLILSLIYLAMFPVGQQPDRAYDVTIQQPVYVEQHPIVLIDSGHFNAHTADGLYLPFARLLANDGYDVKQHEGKFTPESLRNASILVIVNAAGGSNPQLLGFNLVFLRKGERDAPAFSDTEIKTVAEWIRGGGSLLLIADHAPFGSSAESLGKAFGIEMYKGFTEVPNQYVGQPEPGELEFTQSNGLLGDHPIISGWTPDEQIKRIRIFTGQSFDALNAVILLKLPSNAVEQIPNHPLSEPAGSAMGVALDFGKGRVVALGDAAMLTAQVTDGNKFGMNMVGLDNRQFALNLMHWLSHAR